MAWLRIRQDYSPSDLRTRETHEEDCRAALRLLAIANALEGITRAEAARLASMERQALHDAISASMLRALTACTTVLALAARSNSLRVSRLRLRHISCAGLSRSVMGSAPGAWSICVTMSSKPMASAIASGVSPACSSASASRVRRPGPRT